MSAASGIPAVDVIRCDRVVRVGSRDMCAARKAPATTPVATVKVRVPTPREGRMAATTREADMAATTARHRVATATSEMGATTTAASNVSATTTPTTVAVTGAGRHRSPQHRDRGSSH